MKVLHFVSIMNRAGQETFIMNMYRNIDKSKVQFGFLCTINKEGHYDKEIKELGGEIHYINLDQKDGKMRHFDNYKVMCKEFKQYVDEYDVFHIHNYHAFDMFLAAQAAVKAKFRKVIVHSHNSSVESHIKLHTIFKPLLNKLSVEKLACSKMAGRWMYTDETFTVIPNGIDAKRFQFNEDVRNEVRDLLDVKNEFVIGHVGRFEPPKNHEFIIDVFAEFCKKHDNTTLILLGVGYLQESIKEKVEKAGICDKVKFLGSRDDTDRLYQAMDVFFFPSLFEGLGIVTVEAQSAGLPCLIASHLPEDIDINSNVRRCSLEEPLEVWCKKLEDIYQETKQTVRLKSVEKVEEAGFDAVLSAQKLQRIYME